MSHLAPIQTQHIPAIAHLHAGALAGDFLPSLGEPFLRVFYRTALQNGLACGYVGLDGGRVSGFVLGSTDTPALFRQTIVKSGPALGWAAIPAVLRRPGLLLKVGETFLYPGREAGAAGQAELLVIAVEAAQRGRGLGAELVQALESAFQELGIYTYKVTVLQANAGANRFYQRHGFRQTAQFTLYGKGWNLYLKHLEREANEGIRNPADL